MLILKLHKHFSYLNTMSSERAVHHLLGKKPYLFLLLKSGTKPAYKSMKQHIYQTKVQTPQDWDLNSVINIIWGLIWKKLIHTRSPVPSQLVIQQFHLLVHLFSCFLLSLSEKTGVITKRSFFFFCSGSLGSHQHWILHPIRQIHRKIQLNCNGKTQNYYSHALNE